MESPVLDSMRSLGQLGVGEAVSVSQVYPASFPQGLYWGINLKYMNKRSWDLMFGAAKKNTYTLK